MKIRGRTNARGVVYYERLNKDAVRSADNLPKGPYRRPSQADKIPHSDPSKIPIMPNELGRRSMVAKVQNGEIQGAEAEEIMRKSKCLAPAYNKGAYQYVGSTQNARDAGHKGAGEGER